MASTRKKTKKKQVVDDMIRVRGVEFALVGRCVLSRPFDVSKCPQFSRTFPG